MTLSPNPLIHSQTVAEPAMKQGLAAAIDINVIVYRLVNFA
jgi:hypothetical protein